MMKYFQAIYSIRLNRLGCSPLITNLRVVLSIFCTICFFVVFITAALAAKDYNGKYYLQLNVCKYINAK